MMDQIVKSLSPAEIERIQGVQAPVAQSTPEPVVRQILPEGFEAERSVQLAVPISVNDLAITTVTVRRLKGRDLRAIQTMSGEEDVALLSLVTGLSPEVIGELDLSDYLALLETAQDFLPRQLRTAAASTAANGQSSQL